MTEISLQGAPIHTQGSLPAVGEKAPDFIVTKTDLSEINLKNYLGRKIILNIFPSLDTSTCAASMLRFNSIAQQFPDTLILCISADLPFAQKRFCAAEHLANVHPVSVFRHPQFGKDYGVIIQDGPLIGLLSRAIVLLNEQGTVIYTQQVAEITEEADYAKLIQALGHS